MFEPTVKQAEVYENSTARTNLSVGAVRSGKTKLCVILIPKRMEDIPKGECGLFGKTLATLSRNVLKPLREYYSEKHISDMKRSLEGAYFVTIFGREFICVGANDKSSETKIRGSTLVYAYCDEISTWDEGFFQMLLSRLDSKDAKLDGTTNPDHPNHWLKKYIDKSKESGASVKTFNFHIDDNPTLDRGYVENLKKTYAGTVYYDRFIQGRWAAGEGSIYTAYNKCPDDYTCDDDMLTEINHSILAIDFGENKSSIAMTCVGFTNNLSKIIIPYAELYKGHADVDLLKTQIINFGNNCKKYNPKMCYPDNANKTVANITKNVLELNCLIPTKTDYAKLEIKDRIMLTCALFGKKMIYIHKDCRIVHDAFASAVWKDDKNSIKDERLDNGTSNIDTLDTFEYAITHYYRELKLLSSL